MDSERCYRNLSTLDYFIEQKLIFRTICPEDDNLNTLTLNIIHDLFMNNDIIGARRVPLWSRQSSDGRTRERIFCRRVRYHTHGLKTRIKIQPTRCAHSILRTSFTNELSVPAAGRRLSSDTKLHNGHHFSQARSNHPKSSQFRVEWVLYEARGYRTPLYCHGARVSYR